MGSIHIIKTLSTVLSNAINKSQQHQEKNSWECRESILYFSTVTCNQVTLRGESLAVLGKLKRIPSCPALGEVGSNKHRMSQCSLVNLTTTRVTYRLSEPQFEHLMPE